MKKNILIVTHTHRFGASWYLTQTDLEYSDLIDEELCDFFDIDFDEEREEALEIDLFSIKDLRVFEGSTSPPIIY